MSRAKRLLGAAIVAGVASTVVSGALGVSGSDTITTIAGGGKGGASGFSGDGGPATSAQLHYSRGVAVDGQGNVYIADNVNERVRKVSAGGTITTIAGGGASRGDGGPATSARLLQPSGVAVDGSGNVYIADSWDVRVRKVTPGGRITTFAGTGERGLPGAGDGGPATSAKLYDPRSVAVDSQGNVYIGETLYRVRKVSPSGTITTIAGTGVRGYSGDGGPATSAKLDTPWGIAVDGRGNVYIADGENRRVRKVSPGGTITTIAGTGVRGFSGDGGPATSARLTSPYGVAVDRKGNVFIADRSNHRVRIVSPGGTITTIAGTGVPGFSGDGGPASAAKLNEPWGVATDGEGDVYISDTGNNRVRKVSAASAAGALTLTLGGASSQRLLARKGITVTAKCNKPCSLSATGSVTIVGTKHVFALTRATAPLAAGKRTLRLRCSAAQQQRFRKLFKSDQQARAVITVRATDGASRTTTSRRDVAVR